MPNRIIVAVILTFFMALNTVVADPVHDELMSLAKSNIQKWINDPVLITKILSQNKAHASTSQDKIISMDKTWRSETQSSKSPFIDSIMTSSASDYLRAVKSKNAGLFTEIFVMDNKGMNVAQSDVTSDYWQGDEAKWQKTYSIGSGAIHIGKIKKDESTQKLQAQVSMAITDPSTNHVIGAVTVGINVDNL